MLAKWQNKKFPVLIPSQKYRYEPLCMHKNTFKRAKFFM